MASSSSFRLQTLSAARTRPVTRVPPHARATARLVTAPTASLPARHCGCERPLKSAPGAAISQAGPGEAETQGHSARRGQGGGRKRERSWGLHLGINPLYSLALELLYLQTDDAGNTSLCLGHLDGFSVH